MGRPMNYGLGFFPLQVDFFDDPKILLAEERHGVHGGYIAARLLTIIYREGYYMSWDNDSPLTVSKRIGNGISSDLVSSVLTTLLEKGFFHKQMFQQYQILTSAGIQRRWLYVMDKLRRKGVVNDLYRLISSEENGVSSEETTSKPAISTQTKQNKTKQNKNTPMSPKGEGVLFSQEDPPVADNWESDFLRFWNLYGKKTGRAKCEKKFSRLSKDDRAKVLQHVPQYVLAWPDPQYRKNPEGYLNGRLWEDEYLPGKESANTPTTKQKIVV